MVECQKDKDGNLMTYTNHKFEQIWNNFEHRALTTPMRAILDQINLEDTSKMLIAPYH